MRLASVLQKLPEYCNPRKNITILRYRFFTYRQHEGQYFHDFVTELKKLSSECEFEILHQSLIINDMIVCGTNDNSLKERLLRESELTLSKAISAGHAAEETRKHACEILKSNETINLYKISKHTKSRSQTSAQATEIIKKLKFVKILTTVVNVPPIEKFAITVIRTTILRNAIHVIEKISTK